MPLKGREQLIRTLEARVEKFVRALALEAHGRLIKKTPRRTGRAAANWQLVLGEPVPQVHEARTIGDLQAAATEAQSAAAAYQLGDPHIYLVNGLPYIPALEDGHSKQAPAGMIKVTAAELEPLTRQIVAKIVSGG